DDQDVAIAFRCRPAFDWGVFGHGIRTRIALIGVAERDRRLFLIARHDHVRNAVRIAAIDSAEIRMERLIEANALDKVIGVGIDGFLGDVLVPGIVVGEEAFAAEAGVGPELDGIVLVLVLLLAA